MGSFVFKWNQPATVVYVTGTFDDWKKTEQLEKVGDSFEKKVTLPDASTKIFYKVRRSLYKASSPPFPKSALLAVMCTRVP
ncbi:hypothetical protein O1611_g2657 [Lasiodiplodia mahajangana]|uniref:Uncharacterized protein n=1 Tax=Lasiodiplodia mahajangana TaxID=1108764 RepID=A0ACC2JTX5_9PEZI|nr:hypothetical protein O1611_g2657 [Lasiodiplodia mahajangana]